LEGKFCGVFEWFVTAALMRSLFDMKMTKDRYPRTSEDLPLHQLRIINRNSSNVNDGFCKLILLTQGNCTNNPKSNSSTKETHTGTVLLLFNKSDTKKSTKCCNEFPHPL
jgi:hypothetical protein